MTILFYVLNDMIIRTGSEDFRRTIIDVNSFLLGYLGFFNDNLGHASRISQMSELLRQGSNAFKI